MAFIPSQIHKLARLTTAAAPEAFRDPKHPTASELNNFYNPTTNPNGKIYAILCAFGEFDFSMSATTEDSVKACFEQAVQDVSGWDYGIEANVRFDRNMDAYSANNFMRELTMEPDRNFIIVDRVRYAGGPNDDTKFAVGDWVRMQEHSTDVQNYNIANGAYASFDFAPFASGGVWDTIVELQGSSASFEAGYSDPDEFRCNENVDLFVGTRGSIADPKVPTAAEINAMDNIVEVVPFADATFPHATASESVSDPAISQPANAKKRGLGGFEASLTAWYPKEPLTDVGNKQVRLANLMRQTLGKIDIVTRIAQSQEGEREPVKVGDIVTIGRFKTTKALVPEPDGNNAYRISTELLNDGLFYVNKIVAPAVPDEAIVVTSAGSESTVAPGATLSLFASLYGHNVTYAVDWSTSDSTKADVSELGIVTGIAAGTATITAAHPSGISDTFDITVSAAVVPTVLLPASLPTAGGTIDITGTGLTAIKSITVDGVLVDWFAPATALAGEMIVPAHAAGDVDVVFTPYVGDAVTVEGTYA